MHSEKTGWADKSHMIYDLVKFRLGVCSRHLSLLFRFPHFGQTMATSSSEDDMPLMKRKKQVKTGTEASLLPILSA